MVCLCAWEEVSKSMKEANEMRLGLAKDLSRGKSDLFLEAQTTAIRTGWKWESRLHHCLGKAG